MPSLKQKLLGAGLLVFVAASGSAAKAVTFGFDLVSGTPGLGELLVFDLTVDTEGETLQAWFLQVNHAGSLAADASIEPFVFSGVVAAPVFEAPALGGLDGGQATGPFAMATAPGVGIPPGLQFVYGQIAIVPFSPGTITLSPALGGGIFDADGQDLVAAGLATFGSWPIPEPGTATLLWLGLAALTLRRPHRG